MPRPPICGDLAGHRDETVAFRRHRCYALISRNPPYQDRDFALLGEAIPIPELAPISRCPENSKSAILLSKMTGLRGDNMNWLRLLLTRMCITALFAGFGAAVSQAAAPILPVCSWPFEVTGQGITNVATPDTNATYWVMPLDLSRWRAMVIHGQYPDARFFNFATYTATGSFIDTIFH